MKTLLRLFAESVSVLRSVFLEEELKLLLYVMERFQMSLANLGNHVSTALLKELAKKRIEPEYDPAHWEEVLNFRDPVSYAKELGVDTELLKKKLAELSPREKCSLDVWCATFWDIYGSYDDDEYPYFDDYLKLPVISSMITPPLDKLDNAIKLMDRTRDAFKSEMIEMARKDTEEAVKEIRRWIPQG